VATPSQETSLVFQLNCFKITIFKEPEFLSLSNCTTLYGDLKLKFTWSQNRFLETFAGNHYHYIIEGLIGQKILKKNRIPPIDWRGVPLS
jgi:hypothetical protein